MNSNTQRQQIIKLLQERGDRGVSSYELTYSHQIKQAPTRVYELRKLGFNIISKPFRNSVIYVLSNKPKDAPVEKPKQQWQIEAEQSERLERYQVGDRYFWDTPENIKKKGYEQLSI